MRGLQPHMCGDPPLGRDPRQVLDVLLGINKAAEWEMVMGYGYSDCVRDEALVIPVTWVKNPPERFHECNVA